LHDLAEYEANGVPAVLVASDEFASAVESQKYSLGTSPAVVFVRHPIQSRTDAELEELAERTFDQALGALLEN